MSRGIYIIANDRVVEARQIVMNQRSTVQQFERGSGGIGERGIVIAAGSSHSQAQAGTDSRTGRKDRMAHRRRQARRGRCVARRRKHVDQRALNALAGIESMGCIHCASCLP